MCRMNNRIWRVIYIKKWWTLKSHSNYTDAPFVLYHFYGLLNWGIVQRLRENAFIFGAQTDIKKWIVVFVHRIIVSVIYSGGFFTPLHDCVTLFQKELLRNYIVNKKNAYFGWNGDVEWNERFFSLHFNIFLVFDVMP